MSLVMFTARAGTNGPVPVKAVESGGRQLGLWVVSLDSDPSQSGSHSPECRGQDGDRGLDSHMFSGRFQEFLE